MNDQKNFKMNETPGYLIYLASMRNKLVQKKTYQRAGYDLTPEQVGLLNRLYEKEGMTQRELAESTFKDKPNTTRIIDQLEKKNLVKRKPHPTDRRASCLFLTHKGRQTREDIISTLIELSKRVYKNFSKEEKKQLIFLVTKFYRNLGKEL